MVTLIIDNRYPSRFILPMSSINKCKVFQSKKLSLALLVFFLGCGGVRSEVQLDSPGPKEEPAASIEPDEIEKQSTDSKSNAVCSGIYKIATEQALEKVADCVIVEGHLFFESLNIGALALPKLKKVLGNLEINACSGIHTLVGLENLTVVEGKLKISRNPAITDLSGLSKLEHVGNLTISDNENLESIVGLETLRFVRQHIEVSANPKLRNLRGFKNDIYRPLILLCGNLIRILRAGTEFYCLVKPIRRVIKHPLVPMPLCLNRGGSMESGQRQENSR
ncbi:MAG: hypothetical protein GY854_02480 [Deltaproteobacteria bacterium]|nr:hypothetical protein [Deltaproteobacteria bacterium]